MLIACKYEEMYIPEINDFVYLTNNQCSAAAIRAMEIKILSALDYVLGRPLPIHFLRRFSKAANVCANTHNLAKYILEVGMLQEKFSSVAPSLQAAAASLVAVWLMKLSDNETDSDVNVENLWTSNLAYYSGYTLEEVTPIAEKYAIILKTVHTSKHAHPFAKYSKASKFKVADLVVQHLDKLDMFSELF